MQYIQLQGQVSTDLDLPINGAYNLFIDTSDNSIKVKDGDGYIHGGISTLTELTYNQLTSSIASGSLTPGSFYKITGVATGSFFDAIQEGGVDIILQAANTSSINSKGIGLFWNPNYNSASVWDNTFALQMDVNSLSISAFFNSEEVIICDAPSNVILRPNVIESTAFAIVDIYQSASFFSNLSNYPIPFYSQTTNITGSFIGVFASSSYATGDKAIWGGRVWENTSGNIGYISNQFELGPEDWTVVPYQSGPYTLVANEIEFDIDNNYISYRRDAIKNIEVTGKYNVNDSIKYFPWGHYGIENVSLENCNLSNFVNFHDTNTINGLHLKHESRFEANYWGRYNQFEYIYGDIDSDISSLCLGQASGFRNIRLGINSTIGSSGPIFVVGNDGGNAIADITMGNNADLYDMEMYQYSQMHNITIGADSSIYGFNMYNESQMYYFNLETNCSINSTSMGNSSYIRNIELHNNSYIANFNLDAYAHLNDITLGDSSYMEYMNLGRYCYISEVEFGIDCGSYCNSLYEVNNVGSSITGISLGSNSNFGAITLYPGTYIQNINASNSTSFNQLTITGSDSYLANFEIEQNGGFGNFTIDGTAEPVNFNTFKIGQDSGFGGLGTVATTNTTVTVERGFSNFQANEHISGITGSLNWNDIGTMPQLDTIKTFHILDTTGWDAATTDLNYYLPDGSYNGQTVKFFLTGDGTNMTGTNIGRLRIWCNMGLPYNVTSAGGNNPWYPFSKYDYTQSQYIIRPDVPTAIWLNGKWIIDNDNWD